MQIVADKARCLQGEGDGSRTIELFGEWQTEAYTPPAAANGIVPKNERGNVEAPPFAKCLPAGTTHIDEPRVFAACRRLGVDFAPALVGFEPEPARHAAKDRGRGGVRRRGSGGARERGRGRARAAGEGTSEAVRTTSLSPVVDTLTCLRARVC